MLGARPTSCNSIWMQSRLEIIAAYSIYLSMESDFVPPFPEAIGSSHENLTEFVLDVV